MAKSCLVHFGITPPPPPPPPFFFAFLLLILDVYPNPSKKMHLKYLHTTTAFITINVSDTSKQ